MRNHSWFQNLLRQSKHISKNYSIGIERERERELAVGSFVSCPMVRNGWADARSWEQEPRLL